MSASETTNVYDRQEDYGWLPWDDLPTPPQPAARKHGWWSRWCCCGRT